MASDNSDKILCQGWLQKRGREGLNALSTIASSIGGALGSLGLWKQRFVGVEFLWIYLFF